ncbi:MAG: sugar transferase [Muribaculum sp.]|nr:sugar transferase [Muribaculum sp.]
MQRSFKRLIDIVVSVIFLIFVFPFVYIIFGILIKASSHGPVIYRQKRHGLNGKVFTCLKFRSMVVNDTADTETCTKDDKRVTRIGRIMRHTFVDELPQFINVLQGEMSLIGPRPHMLKHTEEFSAVVDCYMDRLTVRPGITGLAQALGYNGPVVTDRDIRNRVRLDMWYIRNWSGMLDAKIFVRTLGTFLKFKKISII